MIKLSCVVVDDQPSCISLLTRYIQKFDDLDLLKSFTDPFLAKEFILMQTKLDILFTDVDMVGRSGIKLAESIEDRVENIVFVTSHFQHELKPNLKKKWHYLFKPTSLENFQELFQQLQNDSRD